MIHIATVHFQSDKWIRVQQAFLQKHIHSPFRVYGWLNEVRSFPREAFFYSCAESVESHAVKLNLLADVIQFAADDERDLLFFLDGDAFPVGDVEGFVRGKLKTHDLVAVQRLENDGDIQPHPSFCATTVGFWRAIQGDWKEGYKWKNNSDLEVTDVGGNLLGLLQERNSKWHPMLRTGGLTSHPVLFGIYDNLIYHHGAGFRKPMTRRDWASPQMTFRDKVSAVFPWRRGRVMARRLESENQMASDQIFNSIERNPLFFEERLAHTRAASRGERD